MTAALGRTYGWELSRLPTPGTAQVWFALPEDVSAWADRAWAFLSSQERRRAGQMAAAGPRQGFMVRRAVLRCLLAERYGVAPDALAFEYGDVGKPRLAGGSGAFSVASAGEAFLWALCDDAEIGVDLEAWQRVAACGEAWADYCSPSEAAAVRAARADERVSLIATLWVRKEAWAKATGLGLGADLRQMDVLDAGLAEGVALVDLTGLPSGFHGALACLRTSR